MNKESNALGYLYEVIGEVFGDKLDIIKQALEDKDKEIENVKLIDTKFKQKATLNAIKLDKIEEVVNKHEQVISVKLIKQILGEE